MSQDPTSLGTEGKAKMQGEIRRMGMWRKVNKGIKGRRGKSGWKKGEDRVTDLERQRALTFLEEKQKHLWGSLTSGRSEELQETPLVQMLWKDASCPPYTW